MSCVYLSQELWFPPVDEAEDIGLLAIGGDLNPQRLLLAYSLGIFPWYNPGEPILWWSPDPRCVLFPGNIHISRSLRRALKRSELSVTFDQDFPGVVRACRGMRSDEGTWITPEMYQAYVGLYRLGFAHSVECWRKDQLVGGLYGISLGRIFFGESMFSKEDNASKIALVTLCGRLLESGFRVIDCQQTSPHLLSLGAEEISRRDFCRLLEEGILDEGGELRSGFPSTPPPS